MHRYKSLLCLIEPPPADGENCIIMLHRLAPVKKGSFQLGVSKVTVHKQVNKISCTSYNTWKIFTNHYNFSDCSSTIICVLIRFSWKKSCISCWRGSVTVCWTSPLWHCRDTPACILSGRTLSNLSGVWPGCKPVPEASWPGDVYVRFTALVWCLPDFLQSGVSVLRLDV